MNGHRSERPYLRAVPKPTERHLAAVERRQPAEVVPLGDQSLDAIARAIEALPPEQKPTGREHVAIVGEHGILVRHCIVCDGTHHTLWDRIIVGLWSDCQGTVFLAWWDCPNRPGQKLCEPLGDLDFADAMESGADFQPDAEIEAEVIQFRAFLEHPGVTATSIGRRRPTTDPNGDAA